MARVAQAPAEAAPAPAPEARQAEPLGPPAVPTPSPARAQERVEPRREPWAPVEPALHQPTVLDPGRQPSAAPARVAAAGVTGTPGFPPSAGTQITAAPRETDAERQERRARRDRQNINITLYVASLLLVAAAALFIGTGLPPMLRFAGVCAVAVAFYAAGFVLHAKVARLKPAAVAFTGTGLALVPVTGLAMYNFVWSDGPRVAGHLAGGNGCLCGGVGAVGEQGSGLPFADVPDLDGLVRYCSARRCPGLVLRGPYCGINRLYRAFPGQARLAPTVVCAAAGCPASRPGPGRGPGGHLHSGPDFRIRIRVGHLPVRPVLCRHCSRPQQPAAGAALLRCTGSPYRGVVRGGRKLTGHRADGLVAASVLVAAQAIAVAYGMPVLATWFPTAPGKEAEPNPVRAQGQAAVPAGRQAAVPAKVGGSWRFDALGTFAVQVLADRRFRRWRWNSSGRARAVCRCGFRCFSSWPPA